MEFFQEGPRLKNQFETDAVLKQYLAKTLPNDVRSDVEPDLRAMGERAVTDLWDLALEAESQPPQLIQYDPWGRRVDEIRVSRAWKEFDAISAREGIVAIGYERKHGAWSRVHQFAKLYLFGPSSAIYSCPLAMTDGAARAIEVYGDNDLKRGALKHLTSRDPATFWTSGQWMTEKTGGSDVSGTSTVAKKEGQHYSLRGTKWFTSATTSQMAMTLARPEGAPAGSKGLSLFYLELRKPDGSLNNISILRLKDKLGTRALPTAELELQGVPARLVGDEGHGVRKISTLFNITRVYNAVSAVGYMRRALALAWEYAQRRNAFGKFLAEQPLHLVTLGDLQAEFEGCFLMTFELCRLLGAIETGAAGEGEAEVFRILTPVVKLYTAKAAVKVVSECLECFGGAGYVEDTGIPRILRDTQVLSIWEGTTNVLSLDVLRSIEKENTLDPLLKNLEKRAAGNPAILKQIPEIRRFFDGAEDSARTFAFALARLTGAVLLHEQGFQASANLWCRQPFISSASSNNAKEARDLVKRI